MKVNKKVEMTITQGEIKVNTAYVYAYSKEIIAISIDCRSKWPEIEAIGSDNDIPDIVLGAGESTTNIQKGTKHPLTVISFPELKYYDIWSSQVCKYAVNLCFIKVSRR